MSIRVGFLVNPIAGMGGRVGLKGTDGVVSEAVKRGANPIAYDRSFEAISFLKGTYPNDEISWLTCNGQMGADILLNVGITSFSIAHDSTSTRSTANDTKKACKQFLNRDVDIIYFCGGDGTARDIVEIVDRKVPILGIPSGVKMHSAVFAVTPTASAKMIHEYIHGHLRKGDADIIDLDEGMYRKGSWKIRLYATALGLVEPTYIQTGKAIFSEMSEIEVKDDIAGHIADIMEEHTNNIFFFGSGGTIEHIAKKLNINNTVLGIDAVMRGKTIASDVNESQLLELLKTYTKAKIIISPIGAQGFIFGRGNLPFSPQVIRQVGLDNIIVVSTPSKLLVTPILRVDTGDKDLDHLFAEYEIIMVVIGYRKYRVVRIQSNTVSP